MANYAVTTFQNENKSYQAVAASLEASVETIDTTKAIVHYGIVYRRDEGTFVGTLVVIT